MLGDAKRGDTIFRSGRLQRAGPAEEDAVPRARTAMARRAFAHDVALVKALFADLTLWREEKHERVRYLSVRSFGGTEDALRTAVTSILRDVGLGPGQFTLQDIDERQREMPRGQLAVVIPGTVAAQYSARMKWLLSESQHATQAQR